MNDPMRSLNESSNVESILRSTINESSDVESILRSTSNESSDVESILRSNRAMIIKTMSIVVKL